MYQDKSVSISHVFKHYFSTMSIILTPTLFCRTIFLEPLIFLPYMSLNLNHFAVGVFLFVSVSVYVVIRNKRKHHFTEILKKSLRNTIDSFREIDIGDFYPLLDSCKKKLIHKDGYMFYFSCSRTLTIESVVSILYVDLHMIDYKIFSFRQITPSSIRFNVEKNPKDSFAVKILQGYSSNPNQNVFMVHTEKR